MPGNIARSTLTCVKQSKKFALNSPKIFFKTYYVAPLMFTETYKNHKFFDGHLALRMYKIVEFVNATSYVYLETKLGALNFFI